jgi:hypothetical protein
MLVSSNKGNDDHGWNVVDSAFWEPLFAMIGLDLSKTFGQLAHIIFPNIKYVVALATPSTKEERNAPQASIYVSDQNLIEKLDFKALRKMIFDSIEALCPAKYIQRSFACTQEGLNFRADRLNVPTFENTLAGFKHALSQPEAKHVFDQMGPEDMVITSFEPFRDIASIDVDGVELNVHLISVTEPEGMCRIIRGRVIDIFAMTRRLVAEDGKRSIKPKLLFSLDVDTDTQRRRPLATYLLADVNYFELVTAWIDDVSTIRRQSYRAKAFTPRSSWRAIPPTQTKTRPLTNHSS